MISYMEKCDRISDLDNDFRANTIFTLHDDFPAVYYPGFML